MLQLDADRLVFDIPPGDYESLLSTLPLASRRLVTLAGCRGQVCSWRCRQMLPTIGRTIVPGPADQTVGELVSPAVGRA
ncbi:MAG: hypothetical protein ACLRM9_03845 [Collinsella aerofaciens]